MEIADSAKSILSSTEDPKAAWEALEKRFGGKQQGLQSLLMMKLHSSSPRHRCLGHLSFKTVVALAESGANGMVITDLPEKTPGLDACAACVAAKAVDFPQKEGHSRAEG